MIIQTLPTPRQWGKVSLSVFRSKVRIDGRPSIFGKYFDSVAACFLFLYAGRIPVGTEIRYVSGCVGGEGFPLGPTSCGPTPSSGDTPPRSAWRRHRSPAALSGSLVGLRTSDFDRSGSPRPPSSARLPIPNCRRPQESALRGVGFCAAPATVARPAAAETATLLGCATCHRSARSGLSPDRLRPSATGSSAALPGSHASLCIDLSYTVSGSVYTAHPVSTTRSTRIPTPCAWRSQPPVGRFHFKGSAPPHRPAGRQRKNGYPRGSPPSLRHFSL